MTTSFFHIGVLPETGACVLDGPEGRHAATVRRLGVGERLVLTDGAGGVATCEVTAVRKDALDLAVLARDTVPAPEPRLVVVQGLAKGDRGELAVEVMTEAGVDEIVPWQASRSVVQWRGDRGDKALAKWRSTAREAGKQARRAWLPTVTEVMTTAQVARRLESAAAALVLHEEASEPLSRTALPDANGDIVLVVGPEGGVSPGEIDLFTEIGAARPVRLGETVLRTSTAGVAAAAVVFARTGRW